jgi:hypothetical protein
MLIVDKALVHQYKELRACPGFFFLITHHLQPQKRQFADLI